MVGDNRFDVVLVDLSPTRGSEIRNRRPCVVVSPDEMNQSLRTLVVAPMTTQGQAYPWRVRITFQERDGRIALDQIRTIDRARVVRSIGQLDSRTAQAVLQTLAEMFAP